MPNHVHVIFKPFEGFKLENILHSWKSYTANKINQVVGRQGALWYREYYDRIIRDENEMGRGIDYVVKNPLKAGLRDWNWVWVSGEEMPA